MSDVAQRFAELLTHYTAKSPLSQEEIAMSAEIHRTQISKLLKGKQIPRLDTVIKLAGVLDIAPADLLEGMTWKPAARAGQFKFSGTGKRKPGKA